jgi:hypothetical protein
MALVLLGLGALLLRLWLASRSAGLTMDSPLYVRMAEDLLAAHREPAPAHHGYSLLVALASLVLPGRELPGRAVSMLASLALVGVVWVMARRRAGPWRALVPASLVAFHPLLAIYGSAVMTEASFLAIACGGIALLDAGRARAGGALLGAAWWVRPEAAVVAPFAALLAPLRWRERVLALVVAAAVALPYSLLLRVEQGHWSLTPKSVLVRAPFASAREAEWRLADSTAFADTVGIGARLARDGAGIVRAYPTRLLAHGRALLEAWGWMLLLVSAVSLAFGGRGPWLALLVLPFVYPLLSAPADVRFAQLVLPGLALPVVAFLGDRGPFRGRGRLLALAPPLLGLALLWLGPSATRALAFDDGPMSAMRGAGAWLAAHAPADAVVMDRKSYVPFFAARRHVQLPDEPLDVLLAHARTTGATHLVVEEYVAGTLRPQLRALLDPATIAGDPRLRLVFATRPAPGEGVAVFELAR